MDGERVRVLMVGKSETGFSSIKEYLHKLDCHCEFAPSCSHGARLAEQGSFDLILCDVEMEDFQAMVGTALGSPGSAFRFLLVEDGCWWVPTVLMGEQCVGVSALRPFEFVKELDKQISLAYRKLAAPAVSVAMNEGNREDIGFG